MPKRRRSNEAGNILDSCEDGYVIGCEENTLKSNPYMNARPDFANLGKLYPEFGKLLTKTGEHGIPSIDWKDPQSVKELTRTLLRHDFKLEWNMPLNRLCPPLPNRINYLCWISELLQLESPIELEIFQNESKSSAFSLIKGIDIGTGSSCIYPLLGYKMYKWNFLATEIDTESVMWARQNVTTNNLHNHIVVRQVSSSDSLIGPLLSALNDGDGKIDFMMTNPPFFSSGDEVSSNPHKATGKMIADRELICEGGEVGFVGRIIQDSLVLRERIRWYSSLVGRASSVRILLHDLRQSGVLNVRTTEFVQGRLKRWGIAWSFGNYGLTKDGKVPDDPSIKVMAKTKVRYRALRNAASSAFQFKFSFYNPSFSKFSISVTRAGKTEPFRILVPSNLPSKMEELLARFSEFPISRQGSTNLFVIRPKNEQFIPENSICLCGYICNVDGGDCSLKHKIYRNFSENQILPFENNVVNNAEFQPLMDIFVTEIVAEGVCMCTVDIRLVDQGDKDEFVRTCDMMVGEILRQNRHWRRANLR